MSLLKADVHGNIVLYEWKILGKRGLTYLTDIYDTVKASAVTTPPWAFRAPQSTLHITPNSPGRRTDYE
jgi:hypothetical protein